MYSARTVGYLVSHAIIKFLATTYGDHRVEFKTGTEKGDTEMHWPGNEYLNIKVGRSCICSKITWLTRNIFLS